jgi:hypothetical protein
VTGRSASATRLWEGSRGLPGAFLLPHVRARATGLPVGLRSVGWQAAANGPRRCSRHAIGLSLVTATAQEPLEPQLRDLVVPTDRGEHVDQLARLDEP